MARAPTPSQNVGVDGFSYVLSAATIIIGVGLGVWCAWSQFHGEISAGVIALLHWQIVFIDQFTDRFDAADKQMLAANASKVSVPQLVRIAREIGRFFLVPSIAAMLALATLCFVRAGSKRYGRALDLETLMREQVKQFRGPAAFVNRRLGLVDIDHEGPRPADRAFTRAEWVAWWATDQHAVFDEGVARAELTRQLGWPSCVIEKAPAYYRCLLAAFTLHRAQRRDEALAFLGDLSESLAANSNEGREGPKRPLKLPQALTARADQWLTEPDLREPLDRIMERHEFLTPAIMSVLIAARLEGGVLPPAQFGFLKLVDRRLWFALHSLGFPADMFNPQLHPTPRVEAIGARDHWAAERLLGAALPFPSIDRALTAVRADAQYGEIGTSDRKGA